MYDGSPSLNSSSSSRRGSGSEKGSSWRSPPLSPSRLLALAEHELRDDEEVAAGQHGVRVVAVGQAVAQHALVVLYELLERAVGHVAHVAVRADQHAVKPREHKAHSVQRGRAAVGVGLLLLLLLLLLRGHRRVELLVEAVRAEQRCHRSERSQSECAHLAGVARLELSSPVGRTRTAQLAQQLTRVLVHLAAVRQ